MSVQNKVLERTRSLYKHKKQYDVVSTYSSIVVHIVFYCLNRKNNPTEKSESFALVPLIGVLPSGPLSVHNYLQGDILVIRCHRYFT
jgi:hypothetical protein